MKCSFYIQSGDWPAATKSQKRLTWFSKNLRVFLPKIQGNHKVTCQDSRTHFVVARLTWGWVLWPYVLLAIIVFFISCNKNNVKSWDCIWLHRTKENWSGFHWVVRFVFAVSNTCFNIFSTNIFYSQLLYGLSEGVQQTEIRELQRRRQRLIKYILRY
jgi:hypothetical protein